MPNPGIFKSYAIGEVMAAPIADETPGGVKVTHFQLYIHPDNHNEDEDPKEGIVLQCSAWRGAGVAALKQLDAGMLVWAEGKMGSQQINGNCDIVLNVTRFVILSDVEPDAPRFSTAVGSMPVSNDPNNAYGNFRRTHKRDTQAIVVAPTRNRLPPNPLKR